MRGGLGGSLADAVGEPVDGLLGYSFLKHFRIAIDYPVAGCGWTRAGGTSRIAPRSTATPGCSSRTWVERSGSWRSLPGHRLRGPGSGRATSWLAIDGEPVSGLDVVMISRRLEGAPGTALLLRLRRGASEWTCRVVRKSLL